MALASCKKISVSNTFAPTSFYTFPLNAISETQRKLTKYSPNDQGSCNNTACHRPPLSVFDSFLLFQLCDHTSHPIQRCLQHIFFVLSFQTGFSLLRPHIFKKLFCAICLLYCCWFAFIINCLGNL